MGLAWLTVPSSKSSMAMTRFWELRNTTLKTSFLRSRICGMRISTTSLADLICGRSSLISASRKRRPISSAALIWAILAGPSPFNSFQSRVSVWLMLRNVLNLSRTFLAKSMAVVPFVPVLSKIANNSELLKDRSPFLNNFSLGLSSLGQWRIAVERWAGDCIVIPFYHQKKGGAGESLPYLTREQDFIQIMEPHGLKPVVPSLPRSTTAFYRIHPRLKKPWYSA